MGASLFNVAGNKLIKYQVEYLNYENWPSIKDVHVLREERLGFHGEGSDLSIKLYGP